MAWIRTIPEAEADPELSGLYDAARDPHSGRLDHILQIHSLHRRGLKAHLELYTAVMRGTNGLPRVDREMLALVVSGLNGCHY